MLTSSRNVEFKEQVSCDVRNSLCYKNNSASIYFMLQEKYIFYIFFSVRPLSVLRGHSFFLSPPQRPMTSDFEGFSFPNFIHYIYFPILIIAKELIFPFWIGTTGTIFITSLVWRGPWLGIEPGTSRPRSQHSTTRLSRRRWEKYRINYQHVSTLSTL